MLPTITFLVIFFWEVVASPFLPSLHFQYKRMVKMLTYRKKIYWDVNHWLFGYTKKVLKVPFFGCLKILYWIFILFLRSLGSGRFFLNFFCKQPILFYMFLSLFFLWLRNQYIKNNWRSGFGVPHWVYVGYTFCPRFMLFIWSINVVNCMA